jgi:hypothetical protein
MHTDNLTVENLVGTVAAALGMREDYNPFACEALAAAVETVTAAGGDNPFPFPIQAVALRGYRFSYDAELIAAWEKFRGQVLGHQLVLRDEENPRNLERYLRALAEIPADDPRREPCDVGGYCAPIVPVAGREGSVVHTTCTGRTTFILVGRGYYSTYVVNHPAYLIVVRHEGDFDERFDVLGSPEVETSAMMANVTP